MALAYLLSPTFQVENSAGKPATGGWLEVFVSGSRDPYYCYSDFQGTLHPFKIPLDSLGSNVVLADDGQAYDVYVYNRYGGLLMSRYNVKPGHGAGGGGGTITSSDGSIDVTMTPTGYDLKVNGQEASALRAGANDLTSDGQFVFYELVRDGDHVTVDTNGKIRLEDGWYHYDVTARVKWEDGVTVANTENHVQLYTTLNSDIIPFDCSYEHEDTLHLHGQVKITTSGSQFVVGVQGIESGMSIELVDCGLFAITGHGDAAEYEAGEGIIIDDHEISIDPETVQEKLTAGDNIQISEENVISATDTTYTAGTGLELDGTEFSVDTTVIQEKLTAGSNIVIEGNTISATAEPQQQADWTETDSSSVTYIQHKPQNLVQDPDYVHTDNNFTDADKTKLDGIEAGAEANVQADWNETNTSSDAYIQNKPDLSVYATDAELSAGLATKQDTLTAGDNITITNNVISATAAPQEQSDWTETDTSDVSYIKHKPSVKPVVAGNNITITEGNDSFTISATADPQVQADWAQTDSTAVDYIQNKPNLALKEDVANKAQTVIASSTTDYPSSAATAQFVNSSIATATARFLGNYSLTDLGLTYPATDSQIETALDSYSFQSTPTNNDYVYVEIQNPQTTSVDDMVKRFKFNGTNWLYEYTLNNSSFTAAEIAAIDSGVNSTKVGNYDTHIADTTIHVTAADKTAWNGKQDAISDLATIRSGAALGATSVQPSDLATVATTGSYNDLLDLPTIPTVPVQDVQVDGSSVVNASGVAEITMPTELVPTVGSGDNAKVLTAAYDSDTGTGSYSWKVPEGLFVAIYGTSTYAEVHAAVEAGKIVYCSVSGGAGSGAGAGRMAFLAYRNPGWNYEFQYYRSNSSSSGTDSVFVYKLNSTNTWETTERQVKAGNISYPVTTVNVNGSSAMTGTVANITIPAAPTVDQTYDASSSNAQSGTAVAGAISTKQDTISDLATIRSGAALGATAVQPGDLATVALTGSYTDLSNIPHIPVIGTVTL